MDTSKLPSFETHPDFPGQFLNYYVTKMGLIIPVPAAFPREDKADQ